MKHGTTRGPSRAWLWWLSLGTLVAVTQPLLPEEPWAIVVYLTLSATAAAAISLGISWHRGGSAGPWGLLRTGLLLWFLADTIWFVFPLITSHSIGYPSTPDAIYLLGYGFLIAGVVRILKQTAPAARGSLIEGAILATIAAALYWAFVMDSAIEATSSTASALVVTVVYPLMDIVILACVLQLFLSKSTWGMSHTLLVVALVSNAVVDGFYYSNQFPNAAWITSGWLIGYVAYGAAGLHPSMARMQRRGAPSELTQKRLLLLAAAPATIFCAYIVRLLSDDPESGQLLTFVCIAFLLAIFRIGDLARERREAQEKFRIEALKKSQVIDSAFECIITIDAHGVITEFNPAAERTLGFKARDAIGRCALGLIMPPSLRDTHVEILTRGRIEEAHKKPTEVEVTAADGTSIPVAMTVSSFDVDNQTYFTMYLRDLRDAKRAEDIESQFSAWVEADEDAVIPVSLDGEILSWSRGAQKLYGYTSVETVGRNIFDLLAPDEYKTDAECGLMKTGRDQGLSNYETKRRAKDGTLIDVAVSLSPVRNADGEVIAVMGVTRNITQRKELERQLAYRISYDPLTGLGNRGMLQQELARAINGAPGESVVCLLLDLDDFKAVNESLGHEAGDRILHQTALRLRNAVGSAATLARFGADEFAVVLERVSNGYAVIALLNNIMECVRLPFTLDDLNVSLTASIGVAQTGPHAVAGADVLQMAEAAVHAAKVEGKNRYQFYSPDLSEAAARRLRLRAELNTAVDEKQFVVFYQPIIDMQNRRVAGVESLVRWEHPKLGLIPPAEFISAAEESGHILEMGRFVLEEAVAVWPKLARAAGTRDFYIAVNVSARQFDDEGFLAFIRDTIRASRMPAKNLMLEVTESTVLRNPQRLATAFETLRKLGIRIAIDDFGTGYSSLQTLLGLPADMLKIDRSFVSGLVTNEKNLAIVRMMVKLSALAGLTAIAEGIETEQEARLVKSTGCDLGQGFLYGKPAPGSEAPGVIKTLSGRTSAKPRVARTNQSGRPRRRTRDDASVAHDGVPVLSISRAIPG